jgi:hypothetical protein
VYALLESRQGHEGSLSADLGSRAGLPPAQTPSWSRQRDDRWICVQLEAHRPVKLIDVSP